MRPFVVDNDGDPKKVRRALAGLKLMAALGREAEEALRLLESGEIPPGPIPILDRFPSSTSPNLSPRRVKLSERIVLDRAKIMDDLRPEIHVLNPKLKQESGKSVWTVDVMVRKVLLWDKGSLHHFLAEDGPISHVATMRIKQQGRPSLKWNEMWSDGKAFKQTSTLRPGSSDVRWIFAMMYALCAVRWHGLSNMNDVPQGLIATQAALPNWLMEEGLPAKWLEQLQSTAKVVQVMGV